MGLAYFSIEAVARAEPATAVQWVKDALQVAGAVVTDARRLSNKALTFRIEICAQDLLRLDRALTAPIEVSAAERQTLTALHARLEPEQEVIGMLHVTLVHGLPDERIELPKVPG